MAVCGMGKYTTFQYRLIAANLETIKNQLRNDYVMCVSVWCDYTYRVKKSVRCKQWNMDFIIRHEEEKRIVLNENKKKVSKHFAITKS